jgi:large subunit ribosomal protein L18e
MKRGTTNEHLKNLITDLKTLSSKNDIKLWKRIAKDLEKPSRQRREINLSKLSRHAKDNETIIVPGKVLSSGVLDKKLTIAAWQFSSAAKAKIKESKSTSLTIEELMKKNPKGQKVRILG